MMNNRGIDSLIGICRKAGHLVTGGHLTEDAIRKGKAMLVIVTTDASGNTKKRMYDKCTYYEVPIVEYQTMERLGQLIGQGPRAAVAVTDAGLAGAIQQKMKEITDMKD